MPATSRTMQPTPPRGVGAFCFFLTGLNFAIQPDGSVVRGEMAAASGAAAYGAGSTPEGQGTADDSRSQRHKATTTFSTQPERT